MNKSTIVRLLIIAGLVSSLMGCATPGLFKLSKDNFPKAGPKNPVVRIVGMWQPSMGVGHHDKTCRGFSGEVFFFTKDSEIPAKVDGDVKFYVFDDQGTHDEQITPVYENNFTPEAWNQYLGKGSLGASYQIFIPYVRPGNHTANCTLRIRYTPRGGGVPVYSDMVEINLEGKKKPTHDEVLDPPEGADQRSDGPAEAASRGLSQKPPFARGASQAVAIQNDAQPQRRGRVAELTEADRARMIRDVKARLEPESDDGVSLVSHEEQSDRPAPVRSRAARKKPRNPLLDEDQSPEPAGDQGRAEEAPHGEARSAGAAPSVRRSLKHLLEEGEDAAIESDDPEPDRAWRKRGAGASGRQPAHVLDDARRQSPPPTDGQSAQTFTIQLSKSVFDGS